VIGLSSRDMPRLQMDSDAVALAALAVATGRARTRQEVSSAVLERLCEVTWPILG